MDNDEIIRKKKKNNNSERGETGQADDHFRKYVIFYLNKKKYAVSASFIREITLSDDIFFLPFVPPYLSGLLNRHGNPHAVVDFGILINGEKTTGNTFMIMENNDDKIAVITTEVESISNIGDRFFNPLTGDEEKQSLFSGSVSYKGLDILIIEPERIIEQIRAALKSAGK